MFFKKASKLKPLKAFYMTSYDLQLLKTFYLVIIKGVPQSNKVSTIK